MIDKCILEFLSYKITEDSGIYRFLLPGCHGLVGIFLRDSLSPSSGCHYLEEKHYFHRR
jgi:hypothetical protein